MGACSKGQQATKSELRGLVLGGGQVCINLGDVCTLLSWKCHLLPAWKLPSIQTQQMHGSARTERTVQNGEKFLLFVRHLLSLNVGQNQSPLPFKME